MGVWGWHRGPTDILKFKSSFNLVGFILYKPFHYLVIFTENDNDQLICRMDHQGLKL